MRVEDLVNILWVRMPVKATFPDQDEPRTT